MPKGTALQSDKDDSIQNIPSTGKKLPLYKLKRAEINPERSNDPHKIPYNYLFPCGILCLILYLYNTGTLRN